MASRTLPGVAVIGGAVLASAILSARASPAPTNPRTLRYYRRLDKPGFTPPDRVFAVWGPLYALIAWSGLRVWQAPASPARTRALTLFGVSRMLDTLWVWLGFRGHRLGAMAAESVFAIAAAGTYAQQAARVDPRAGLLVLPHVAWLGFAALLSEELWRRNR